MDDVPVTRQELRLRLPGFLKRLFDRRGKLGFDLERCVARLDRFLRLGVFEIYDVVGAAQRLLVFFRFFCHSFDICDGVFVSSRICRSGRAGNVGHLCLERRLFLLVDHFVFHYGLNVFRRVWAARASGKIIGRRRRLVLKRLLVGVRFRALSFGDGLGRFVFELRFFFRTLFETPESRRLVRHRIDLFLVVGQGRLIHVIVLRMIHRQSLSS